MEKEIVNRVANSKLRTLDLEDYYPQGERKSLDISQLLFDGIVLKEKDFREALDEKDWSLYKNSYVALFCSTDAIIPGWAYMLVTTKLIPYAKKIAIGSLEDMEILLFSEIINTIPLDQFANKPVIIKGCASKPIPEAAYVLLVQKLQPIAASIMYGEACSSVPLFKKSKAASVK